MDEPASGVPAPRSDAHDAAVFADRGTAFGRAAGVPAASGQAAAGQPVTSQVPPGQVVPGQATTGQAVPGQAATGQIVPGQGAQAGAPGARPVSGPPGGYGPDGGRHPLAGDSGGHPTTQAGAGGPATGPQGTPPAPSGQHVPPGPGASSGLFGPPAAPGSAARQVPQGTAAVVPGRTVGQPVERGRSTVRPGAERGTTTIADEVVEKVAAIAARAVPGVYDLGGSVARTLAATRERTGRGNRDDRDDGDRGIAARLDGRRVMIRVVMVAEFGYPLYPVADQVRANVIDAVETMLSLEVVAVDVLIEDVHVDEARLAEVVARARG